MGYSSSTGVKDKVIIKNDRSGKVRKEKVIRIVTWAIIVVFIGATFITMLR